MGRVYSVSSGYFCKCFTLLSLFTFLYRLKFVKLIYNSRTNENILTDNFGVVLLKLYVVYFENQIGSKILKMAKLTRKSNPPEMSWKSPLYSSDDELSFPCCDVTTSPFCDVIVTLHFSCCNWRKRGISAQFDNMSTMYWDELRIRQNFSVKGKACSCSRKKLIISSVQNNIWLNKTLIAKKWQINAPV